MPDLFPLQIEHLEKYYKGLHAVNDVSFEVREGEIFGLLGPNGAGKTTIISSITTLEEPSAGSVKVFGVDVMKQPKKAKSYIGCVPQELVHHGFFNIKELLNTYSGYYGILNNQEQVNYLLEKLALKEHAHKQVKQLSGGLKRRVLIAKALLHKPKLLLLDEPTAGIDVELRSILWDFVRELKKSGTSILLTTHYLDEAEKLCDRIGIINHGKLLKVGITHELVKELTERHITITLKSELPKLHHPDLISHEGRHLMFCLPYTHNMGAFIEKLPFELNAIEDLTIKEGSLEEAFQRILGNGQS